ncbi:unnamed protein product [Blumeria hordei]|uniref:2EXR domain-containing protein n=1 Tax=Blumeria hordei TaxID=2867405 RepID=A0A383UY70_BLUHO|nr:unnamed protein product [Blumeria hordei]
MPASISNFFKFSYLPPEIRRHIFSLALPGQYMVPLKLHFSIETGFTVTFDHGAPFDFASGLSPLIKPLTISGLSQTCYELRAVYLAAYPDQIHLRGGGLIHLDFTSSIIYLRQLSELVSDPLASPFFLNPTGFHAAIFAHLNATPFPAWFARLSNLALSIDCIIEYPEASPIVSRPNSSVIEQALFPKMLRPFRALRHIWALADDYWRLDIYFTRNGNIQPYPGEENISVLGKLAERVEQLELWAKYQRAMMQRSNRANTLRPLYEPPTMAIWGNEDIDLWDYLLEPINQLMPDMEPRNVLEAIKQASVISHPDEVPSQ